jgi:hypothetical protein
MNQYIERHNFKVGDVVVVYNRSFSKFVIEGKAEIFSICQQEDMYKVIFFRDWYDDHAYKSDGALIRYVDPNGQDNPEAYLAQLNASIGAKEDPR